MKKIFIGILALLTANSSFAQDAADKKFQAGIVFGAGMTFQDMNTKLMNKDGIGSNLLIGGEFNYMFNETIGISSGLEFDFTTAKYRPGNGSVYYFYNDSKILAQDDISEATHMYSLETRKQKMTYLTIPTMIIFRTNFIGYMRYFGKLGMRHSFLLGQNTNDEGRSRLLSDPLSTFAPLDNNNMKAKNEMWFYSGSLGIAGGAEWNFVGSTCLVAEIGFYYGVTPLYYSRKNPYLMTVQNGADTFFSNAAKQSQLQLKFSFLF